MNYIKINLFINVIFIQFNVSLLKIITYITEIKINVKNYMTAINLIMQ